MARRLLLSYLLQNVSAEARHSPLASLPPQARVFLSETRVPAFTTDFLLASVHAPLFCLDGNVLLQLYSLR
jgi:hypothetical protein